MARIIHRTLICLLSLHFIFILFLAPHIPWLAVVLFLLALAALASQRFGFSPSVSPLKHATAREVFSTVLVLAASFTLEFSAPPKMQRDNIAIVGGNIITGLRDAEVILDGTVLIDDTGAIAQVGKRQDVLVPNTYQVVDASGKFIMPGLINAHTHLWNDGDDPDTPLDVSSWMTSDFTHRIKVLLIDTYIGRRLIAYAMHQNAKKELYTGVTTVRGIGDIGFLDVTLRDQIAKGERIGPNLIVAGKILAISGGHAADIGREFNGPIEARKSVREALHHKVDFIKITSTGGVSDSHRVGEAGELQMTPEEIQAITDEAHRKNTMVAAHAESTQGVREALQAGVDSIEHGAKLDEELLELFRNNPNSLRGFTSLHPTLSIFGREIKLDEAIKTHPTLSVMAQNALLVKDQVVDGFKLAIANDVLVGLGTDAGFVSHKMVWKELKYFMQLGKISAEQAIHMGTLGTAKSIGADAITGSIQAGKRADLLVLNGDPRKDLSLIGSPALVSSNGYLYPVGTESHSPL